MFKAKAMCSVCNNRFYNLLNSYRIHCVEPSSISSPSGGKPSNTLVPVASENEFFNNTPSPKKAKEIELLVQDCHACMPS